MCVQCVAGSLPYVGVAVGGLKMMGWNAKRAGQHLVRPGTTLVPEVDADVSDTAADAEPIRSH